ncbi:ABC transporter ATP-binding protein [Phytoactinopolyspora limicola]|uniref:ABC transporter ATP-binding protein n=1 Tax=Phytoactinopolyspora limicola TaxID=2715536 RepID=UPI001A9CA48E|nr:ABC transporter ATP-binding protein [Phytoactinopolyspora limicola]
MPMPTDHRPGTTPDAEPAAPLEPAPVVPLISVRDLSVEYRVSRTNSWLMAVADVNLDVHEGEFLTVLGSSGCGKTTVMNTIAGLVQPTEGEVLIDGRRVTGPGPDRAVVFQDYALLPWRTVVDNIRFGLEMQPGRRRADWRAQVADAIRLVGLDGFEDSYPRELSGGMQQRVGLARALVAEPRILLMDEPLGAVDALTREVMRAELERVITATGKTVVFITHSIDEAIVLGDRVAVFGAHPGRVLEILPVDLPRPRSEQGVMAQPGFVELRDHLWGVLQGDARSASRGVAGS